MKKILLLVCLTMMMAGCKEDVKTQDNHELVTNKNTENVESWPDSVFRTCVPSVIIKKSTIGLADYNLWDHDYSYLFCTNPPAGNNIEIDLNLIANDANNKKKADWLEENGRYIDYDLSAQYILKSHLIPAGSEPPVNPGDYKSITLAQIKNTTDLGTLRYSTDIYNKYLKVTVGTNVKFEVISDFIPDSPVYSIPFIRSIEKEMHLTDESVLQFANANYLGVNVVIMKVGTSTYSIFDYTRWPTFTIKRYNAL